MKEIRLSDTKLFQGISEPEIHLMLDCLRTEEKKYKKGEITKEDYDHWRYTYPNVEI